MFNHGNNLTTPHQIKKSFFKVARSPYFWLFILALISLLITIFIIKIPFWSSDSESYLDAMKYLLGEKIEAIPYTRLITTPLMLYFSIFASYFTGSLYGGMLAINILFYFLIVFVFYKLVFEIYKEQRIAFLASLLFLFNYCLYNFGPVYAADMAGWFFFVFGSFFAVKYFNNNEERKFYFLAIISAATGVLFKEYGGLGIISLALLILFSNFSWKKKFTEIFMAGFLFIIPILSYYLFFYLKFHFSYLDWYQYALNAFFLNPESSAAKYSLVLLIKVLGWVFLAGWPLFLWGLWQEKKFFDKTRSKILIALLPASLMFLIWPTLTQRIAFIFVPWLALISGFGLSKIKNNFLVIIYIIFYAVINYSVTPILLKAINLPF